MGVVYKARQISLNRVVALKMLVGGPFSSETFRRRFRAEAEAAAKLRHPNIVAIYEMGQHEGLDYFTMDYVAGPSLVEAVRKQPMSPERAAACVQSIAQAVEYAHQHGVLHRDLKPSNVLLDLFDQPRITDFGLAKLVNVDVELTTTGEVLGSPSHMPPEQAASKSAQAGPASDVYSLGALLYHVLSGRP